MNLTSLLAKIAVTIEQITETSGLANLYRQVMEKIPSWNAFQQVISKAGAWTNVQSAALAWRIGKFWSSQGETLTQLDPSIPIDRRLASEVTRSLDRWDPNVLFRYDVEITLSFPKNRDQQSFFVNVQAGHLLTTEEAYQLAFEELMKRFEPRSKPEAGVSAEDYFDASFRLGGFVRYVQG